MYYGQAHMPFHSQAPLLTALYKCAAESHVKLFKRIAFDFPEIRQYNPNTCGAACLAAVYNYYGEDINESTVVKLLGTNKNGTDHRKIVAVSKSKGYKVDDGVNTVAKLKEYTDKGIPVIVAIQAWETVPKDPEKNYSDGHYVVAIGVSNNTVYFEDPSIVNKGYLSIEDFEKRWHDKDVRGLKVDHLGIAVYGKTPVFKQNVAVRIE